MLFAVRHRFPSLQSQPSLSVSLNWQGPTAPVCRPGSLLTGDNSRHPQPLACPGGVRTLKPSVQPQRAAGGMSGGGWQHLAASAKELAGATQTKAKAVTHTLGKAVVSWPGGLPLSEGAAYLTYCCMSPDLLLPCRQCATAAAAAFTVACPAPTCFCSWPPAKRCGSWWHPQRPRLNTRGQMAGT